MRSGRVYFNNEYVGDITETATGMEFRYTEEWLTNDSSQPISHLIPTRPEKFEWSGPSPFFMGLLPEGWLHEIAIGRLQIQVDDWFGQIIQLCRDCIGAVHIEAGGSRKS